jgi:mono/diheme cytochrome c family protein
MPGFKYVFDPQQISAIASYVTTLPPPAPSAAPAPSTPAGMSR